MSERVLMVEVEAAFDGGGAPCYVVECETKRGNLLRYPVKFYGEMGSRKAHRFATQVQNVGVVDLSRWEFIRAIYGSEAYVEDGHEMADIEAEYRDEM